MYRSALSFFLFTFLFLFNKCGKQAQEDENVYTFKNDFQRTGSFTSKDVSNNPKLKWAYQTQGMVTSPVFINDVAYFGCGDGNIYALDIKDAKLKWN